MRCEALVFAGMYVSVAPSSDKSLSHRESVEALCVSGDF